MILSIDKSLMKFCRIIIFNYDDSSLLDMVCKAIYENGDSASLLFHCMNNNINLDCVKQISKTEMEEFLTLYKMYDFSDKVQIIADSDQHGSMFNYVKTGVLTKQEMVDALLYTI